MSIDIDKYQDKIIEDIVLGLAQTTVMCSILNMDKAAKEFMWAYVQVNFNLYVRK